VERIPVVMVHRALWEAPSFLLPEGYCINSFSSGDERLWAKIATAAGEFEKEEIALKHFHSEFGNREGELENRCFFLGTADQKKVGTAMAWYSDSSWGERCGRVHWVAIHPEYQGKGLGKPLVSAVLDYLKSLYSMAYLTTQTTSYKGINMYLDFGFEPYVKEGESYRGWEVLAERLKRSEIIDFLKKTKKLFPPGNGSL
jgi:GNAT superfamily N-acetyltransferase